MQPTHASTIRRRCRSCAKNDVVAATVIEVHPYGLDIEAEGRPGFVQPIELGWRRGIRTTDFRVGAVVAVLVYAITPERFYGSIRQAAPHDDPWVDPARFALGTRHAVVVRRVLDWATEVELANGALGMILARDYAVSLDVGDELHVEVVLVDPDLRKLEVRLVESRDYGNGRVAKASSLGRGPNARYFSRDVRARSRVRSRRVLRRPQ